MKKKLLLGLSLIAFLMVVAFTLWFNYFWGTTEKKAFLEQKISSVLCRQVIIQKAKLQFFPRLMVVLNQVEIKDRDGKSKFISLRNLRLGISFKDIFARTITFNYLILDQPKVLLSRENEKDFNFSDLAIIFSYHIKRNFRLSLKNFIIRGGTIEFNDQTFSPSPVSFRITDLNLKTGKPSRLGLLPISLQGVLKSAEHETQLDVQGEVEPIIEGSKLASVRFLGETQVVNFSLSCLGPYLCAWKKIDSLAGSLKGKLSFQGVVGGDFKAGAELDIVNLKFKNKELLNKELRISQAHLQCTVNREKQNWILSPIQMKLPGLNATGKVRVDTTTSPLFEAEIKTSNFDYQALLPYIPFFLFPREVKDFILEKAMTGRVDKLFFHYSEKPPQTPSEKPISTMTGNLSFRDFSLNIIDEAPRFEHLKGKASFENRDIKVTDLTGTFGNSTMMQSAFTVSETAGLNFFGDFQLDLLEMNNLIHLGTIPPDAFKELKNLQLMNGKGLLTLNVSGPLSKLETLAFTGKLTLQDADFDYKNFRKPATKVNGTLQFTPDTINICDFIGWWAHSPFNCSGKIKDYRLKEKAKIYVHVTSEHADINDLASAFFPWKEVKGEGTVKVFIDFHCLGYQSQNLRFNGQSEMKNLTLIFPAFPYPFTNTEGNVGFSSDGLTFSDVKFQTGSSDISLTGLWEGLSNPKLTGKIKGNFVNFLDFYQPKEEEEEEKPINFTLENVAVNIKQGVYKKLVVETLETEITSHEGFFYFASPRATLGRLRDFTFFNINTIQDNQAQTPTYSKGVVRIPFLKFESGEGYWISRDISLPVSGDQPERFSLTSEIKNLSTENFLKLFPKKNQKLSGILNLAGTVTGKGKNLSDWMNTLQGEMSFTTEKGAVKQFTILSKLFSLLNVSRMFSQDYTTLLSRGMPYDTIQGVFTINEGIAQTDRISLNSPSMKMNGVGDIDLGKKTLDMEVAVQPLETIDKVVGVIPLVGTVLKDEKGAVIVTYYKVTGTFDNSEWKTMVFGSLGRKGQSIFKQIFKLPASILNWNGKDNSGNKKQDSEIEEK